MSRNIVDTHWRKTGGTTRVGPIDAMAFTPVPLWVIWKSWFVFGLVVVFIAFFYFIQTKGYSTRVIFRKLRLFVSGQRKTVRHYW